MFSFTDHAHGLRLRPTATAYGYGLRPTATAYGYGLRLRPTATAYGYVPRIDGEKFDFSCNYVNTRNGFAHVVNLYQNNNDLSHAREHYLNRTWERYQYQTAMLEAVKKAISERRDRLKDYYKWEHKLSRVSSVIMEDVYNQDQLLITLENLKNAVNEYRGG